MILHGLEAFGLTWPPGHVLHVAMEMASRALPAVAGAAEWVVEAAISGVFGMLVGVALISVTTVLPGRFFNS